jgi:penicillin amidase
MTRRRTAVAATLGAAAGIVGIGYYWLLRRPLARTKGTMTLPGLRDRVEILRDRWGVPHIYANSVRDLMFAQGFAHAQDRLWQMEFQRRLVAGRLSEVIGAQTVDVDRWIRILGMRRVAEREATLLDDEAHSYLEAYASGVSARIAQGRLPPEFTLLRFRPEPWTVADTISWSKMMSWVLSANWESELLRALLISRLGPELVAELDADHGHGEPIIVPPGIDFSELGSGALDRADATRPFTGPIAQDGLGSNNWVLSGGRTASGAPLLANDMHLPMNLPCIWYENHLVGGDVDVTGITFPGIPGVVSGHNGHVAWGYTNGFADVQDLYMERLRRTANGGVEYEYNGQWLEAEAVREVIDVRGGETVTEEVIITRHGPIINALAEDLAGHGSPNLPKGQALPESQPPAEGQPPGEGQPLALRWTSLEPDSMFVALFEMMRARTCLEFREALRHWAAPNQNVVYADTAGNIGYSYAGKIPIRAKGKGQVPAPGWTGEYEWKGHIPFEELPHLYNPQQGYIATANNRVVGDDYPYYLGREFANGHRAQRIVEMIEKQEGDPNGDPHGIDIRYIQQMHFDLVSPFGREMSGFLGALQVDDPQLASVVALMRDWNGHMGAESPEAAVHEVFVQRMIYRLLQDKLGDLAARYAGKGPNPALAGGSMFGARAWDWLRTTLAQRESHWFDLGGGETREDVMRLVLRETVDFLKAELGPEIDDWAWGKLHTLSYTHQLGQVKPLDRLLNRGPYPVGGDGSTVWATGSSRFDLSSEVIIGPPFRYIADLGDLRKSVGLLAPGQSGQPGSQHYDDQIEAWFEGEYHPMLYAREDVERGATARLQLLPLESR